MNRAVHRGADAARPHAGAPSRAEGADVELLLALVCDEAGESPEGKLDLTGVFNDLFAPGFPARQDRMVLVLAVEWDRADQGRYNFRVDLVDPDGEPALTVDGHTDVDPRPADRPPPRTRLVLPLEGVVFPKPGAYRFRVRMKGHEFEGPPLHLMETGEPGTGEHAGAGENPESGSGG